MSLLLVFFAICLYQLADKDGRQGWLWAICYAATSMLLGQIARIGGLADLIAFIAAIVIMIYSKPIKRKW